MVALVEAIAQCAVKLNPRQPPHDQFRILVVAPTNTAADFITYKLSLAGLNKQQLLRLARVTVAQHLGALQAAEVEARRE